MKKDILFLAIKEQIDKYDAFSLLKIGAPKDEFDNESKMIYGRLKRGMSTSEIASIIAEVMSSQFGENFPIEDFLPYAEEIEKTLNSELSHIVDEQNILEFVKSANLKGKVFLGEDWFGWDLGNLQLAFSLDSQETYVELSSGKKYLTHIHVDNNVLKDLISKINRDDQMIEITVTPLFSSFNVVNATSTKKRSWFWRRYYYSN